ncbi:MAG: glucosamine-6-phosphate deaminase [Terriglobia bacterium]|nr:glucosamine-6-phosphate deaminase [Terriglobia bacterium]
MGTENSAIQNLQVGSLKVQIHPDGRSAGAAAAQAVAEYLRQQASAVEEIAVIFATGASQLETLRALTGAPGLPWDRVNGFHLDEYVGIDENHPASFRRYLRENLIDRAAMREFHAINGSAEDPQAVCREYAQQLRAANPQLCLLGVGENGHLAFNDPGEADFHDPEDVKIVHLDAVCRQQQAAEGWFKRLEDVPTRAITLTIPALFRVPKLILTIPGSRKATIVRRTLTESISADCPATILRTHPDATAYIDQEAASELGELSSS